MRTDEYIRTLTDTQLRRLWHRIWQRIEYNTGSRLGWDWPTLRAVYPGFASVLKAIGQETKRRKDENDG